MVLVGRIGFYHEMSGAVREGLGLAMSEEGLWQWKHDGLMGSGTWFPELFLDHSFALCLHKRSPKPG